MTVTSPIETGPDDRRAKRVVVLLVWAQAILGAQTPVHFILGGLAGNYLAPDPALATLPISMTVMGSMFAAPVISQIMGRFGRRTGFMLGAGCGAIGGALCAQALMIGSFALFLAGSLVLGFYLAAHGLYRFAAADLASDAFKPKAISWVMAGGLLAALIGPELVKHFGDALAPVPFAGAYAFITVLNLIGALPLILLDIPVPKADDSTGATTEATAVRSWRELMRDRRVPVAMLCAMLTYMLMNLVMTSTPLAMIACGFGTNDAAEVVRLHVLCMYVPSFFTGPLIVRFGAPRIIGVGILAIATAAAIALTGIEIQNFFATLALVGIGWNFGFIGSTSLLAAAHRPLERAKVQGTNDFLVFGLVTIGSFSSGLLLSGFGWNAVNIAVLPIALIALAALFWLRAGSR